MTSVPKNFFPGAIY